MILGVISKDGQIKGVRGFSLIELLVVVTIIAGLSAILLPSLATARAKAWQMTCMNNARTLGIAMSLYLQNNHQIFPGNEGRVGLSSTKEFWGRPGTMEGYDQPANERLLNAYLAVVGPNDDVEVCRDPADRGIPSGLGISISENYGTFGSSYSYNANVNGGYAGCRFNTLSGIKLSEVRTPAFTALLGCDPMHNWTQFDRIVGCVIFDFGMRWHDPTKPTANICYVDGHVSYVEVRSIGTAEQEFTFMPSPDWPN